MIRLKETDSNEYGLFYFIIIISIKIFFIFVQNKSKLA